MSVWLFYNPMADSVMLDWAVSIYFLDWYHLFQAQQNKRQTNHFVSFHFERRLGLTANPVA